MILAPFTRTLRTMLSVVFICCFCLTPAVSAELEAKCKQAAALFEQKDYQAAYEAYLNLMREYPEAPEVNLGLARGAKMAGKYNHARMAYDRIIAAAPNNAVLHFELAQVFLAMNDQVSAQTELAKAKELNADIPTEGLEAAISAIERGMATWAFSGRIAGGALYDSNITTGPSSALVTVGDFPIRLDSDSTDKDSFGTYTHAAIDVGWRSSPASSWWVVGDVTGYSRWYEQEKYERDLLYGRAALGIRFAEGNVLADVRAKATTTLEGGRTAEDTFGLEARGFYSVTDTLLAYIKGGAEARKDRRVEDRKGTYAWVEPGLRVYFSGVRHYLDLSGKAFAFGAKDHRFSYNGLEPRATLVFSLPWETTFGLTTAWQHQQYHGPATIFDKNDRCDNQWKAGVFATKQLVKNVQVEVSWQHIKNYSNSDLYKYDQHQVTLGLAYTF